MVKIPRAAPATARSTDRRASLPPSYVADHRAAYVSEVNLDVVAALLVADRCRPIGSPALGRRRLLDVGVGFGSLATLEDVIDFYDAGGRLIPSCRRSSGLSTLLTMRRRRWLPSCGR